MSSKNAKTYQVCTKHRSFDVIHKERKHITILSVAIDQCSVFYAILKCIMQIYLPIRLLTYLKNLKVYCFFPHMILLYDVTIVTCHDTFSQEK